MELNKTDLDLLEQVGKGNYSIKTIAESINKSEKQVYRVAKKLDNNGFIEYRNGKITPLKKVYINYLFQVILDNPNLKKIFSGAGIRILIEMLKPRTILEIIKKTSLKKSIIYRKLKEALRISLIYKENDYYVINEVLWSDVKKFLVEYKLCIESLDQRVPANATIYHKTGRVIVFSSQEQIGSGTAFPAYRDYGINIHSPKHFYTLPERKISIRDVFMHSLYVTEIIFSVRYLIYIALFYQKHKSRLKGINHEILDNLKNVLKGEKISGYPSLEEIKDRAKVYNIKME